MTTLLTCLKKRNLLSDSQLRQLETESEQLTRDDKQLRKHLLQQSLISEEELLQALAEIWHLPVTAVLNQQHIDSEMVTDISIEWLRDKQVMPGRWKGAAAVFSSDPDQLEVLQDIRIMTGHDPVLVLAPTDEIRKAVHQSYYSREMEAGEAASAEDESQAAGHHSSDLLGSADQAPAIKYVNQLLLQAVKMHASDIHLEPRSQLLHVRYRIDGVLYNQPSPAASLTRAAVSRIKIMAGMDIAESRLPQDGTARVHVGEEDLDIRVSTLPVSDGERVVMRLLHRQSTLNTLNDLGMPAEIETELRGMLKRSNGVLWVTGPTGSGKTTTLYAALNHLDTGSRNIMTIEDPVEYQLSNISQMTVRPKIGLTFSAGLRHMLRQDPDVMLVGETRDLETAEIVVRASLTGHLVFSTLHTNDAPSALIRLIDMGTAPYLVTASTVGVLSQRLVRVLCNHCKQEISAADLPERYPHDLIQTYQLSSVYTAAGCDHCMGGYQSRTGIYELMPMSEELDTCIKEGAHLESVRAALLHQGHKTLKDDGMSKVKSGVTTVDEVLRVTG